MQTFLDKLAGHIFDNYEPMLDQICVVLPNRRAGLFLKKNLARYSGKIIWSPEIYSIEDFILKLSGLNIINPVYLQCELFRVHEQPEGDAARHFSEFLKWGPTLLNDFNEIDMYLVSPDKLFNYLNETKALSLWNPENVPLTDFQINYLSFYNSLAKYHQLFAARLLEKKQVYPGLAYRYLADNIEKKIKELKYHKIVFAGFNALTRSEEKIISTLESKGLAEIIWDADMYYVENEVQEAGKFIRSYYKKHSAVDFKWMESNLNSNAREIHLIGVPQLVGQVKITGQILQEFMEGDADFSKTAVVLNDESLIEPLLNSIPESVDEYNVTMGLPLMSTPMFRLIKLVIQLQLNAERFKNPGNGKVRLYYRDILSILNHPYIQLLLNNLDGRLMADSIQQSNRVFFEFDEIISNYCDENEQLKTLNISLFQNWRNQPANAIKCITDLINLLKSALTDPEFDIKTTNNNKDLMLEYLFHFAKIVNKLDGLVKENSFIDNILVFKDMFLNIVRFTNLPFYGEPLKGLQVMGMLETRNLDFRNLIMLSVNDDFIPAGRIANSFITFDVRRVFELPTQKEKNAVYAYHFYRILQRAEKIYLLYNTESGNLGGGEKSRFILQLQNELAKVNPKIKIHEKILSVPTGNIRIDPSINISKSPHVLDILYAYLKRGCSASALNIYRNCTLQFYFKYIVGLEEIEKVEETVEASTLGTVIHDVLRKFYKPLINKVVDTTSIEQMLPNVQDFTIDSFNDKYQGGDISYGKNLLILRVANLFIEKFLKKEIEFLNDLKANGEKSVIRDIERKFETDIQVKYGNLFVDVHLKGIFDRIDVVGKNLRIIDYKSGKVESTNLKLKDWDDLLFDPSLDKCFQLLFYAYIFWKNSTINANELQPGIISLRNLKQGFMKIVLPENQEFSEHILMEFENILQKIFYNMVDPELSFTQTAEVENCRYCEFKSICSRN